MHKYTYYNHFTIHIFVHVDNEIVTVVYDT